MPSHLAVSTGLSARASTALALVLLCATTASADRVDAKAGRVSIRSLRDFERCQKERAGPAAEACLEALKVYVKKHPDAGFEAGKLVRVHYMHWEALDYFGPALRDKPAPRQCADADLRAAVVSGLALPARYAAVAVAQELVSGPCRKGLESSVAAQLKAAGRVYRANACPTLSEGLRRKLCRAEPEATLAEAEPAAPVEQPSKAELIARAPGLREAPPERSEASASQPVQRLEDVFPSLPPAQAGTSSQPELAELRMLDWTLLELDADSAELLRGVHGEELLMARTRGERRPYVVLKFKGIQSPWNERVLVAIERPGPAGKAYVALSDGQESIVMVEKQRQYQAFPRGVTGGLWLHPARPGEQAIKLPTHREITTELAAAQPSF